ncbi:SGNH/GDSL hydrolase family protein [Paenibacillus xylanexedens]|uniref:SGNH/GDSL hydrolase family protein n=1 Tax=Paenibacillus xylanexedens TaxID=528191 RepID=UPI000F525ED8|nr:hypothetical protein [Paenibacillus xylanexedens]RPK27712.1 hypothetical protein EDO6_03235 [Paenibacillus xylanexedens]
MKQTKAWVVWGLTLLILTLGYLGFHSLASSEGSEASQNNSFSNKPKDNLSTTQSKPNQQVETKKTERSVEHSDSVSTTGEGVTVIGDSVLVGIEPYLKGKLPKVIVEGKVGRQMSQAKKLTDELREQGKLGEHIIIELGTNGPFSKDQLRSLLTSLSDAKQVLVVTTRVPKGWQDTVNSNIEEVVPEFKNAKVVDWYAASEGKDEFFYQDGVHLKPDGSRFYASLIIKGLKSN